MCCRRPVAVDYNNPLYELKGGNRTSITDQTLCYWNAVQGADQTYTAIQLDLHPDVVGRLYRTARQIMAWDAVRKQSRLVFGCKAGGATTEVESDEHVFFSWTEVGSISDAVDGRIPVTVRYWYPWLGIWERGNLANCYLHCMGVTTSMDWGEGAPPPPLSDEPWDHIP